MKNKIVAFLSLSLYSSATCFALGAGTPRSVNPHPDLATARAAQQPATFTRATAAVTEGPENLPWWSPDQQKYGIAYESAGGFNEFGQNAIVFTNWFDPVLAYDVFFGYTKNPDTYSEATATTDDLIANTRTVATTYAGDKNRHTFIIGGGLRYLVVQNSWYQLTVGGIAGVVLPNSATYNSGTRTETYLSLSSSDSKSIVDGVGPKNVSQNLAFTVGPRITNEFYLKWFPHLGLGLTTGISTTVGGNTTTATTVQNTTFTENNGVPQPPSVQTTATTSTVVKPGVRGQTFGLGGTQFSLFGSFTLRYVW